MDEHVFKNLRRASYTSAKHVCLDLTRDGWWWWLWLNLALSEAEEYAGPLYLLTNILLVLLCLLTAWLVSVGVTGQPREHSMRSSNQALNYRNNFPPSAEPEGSMPCSQELTRPPPSFPCSCVLNCYKSISYPQTRFIQGFLVLSVYLYLCLQNVLFPSGVAD